MGTVVDREVVVTLLRRELEALAELCGGFDEVTFDRPTCLPGWSVKDVLSHVIGTETMLLGEPTPAVDTSHLTHMRNPPAVANEAWVESMRFLPGAELVGRLRSVTKQRLAVLDAMSQADFDQPSWTPAGPDETYGRFMRIRHFDCYLHELDIREAVGEEDRTDDDQLRLALTEPATALGYIVGKKAGLPQGTTVRIELTGPGAATYLVEVADRARVVEDLSGEATVGLTLDTVLWLRLTGGRGPAAPHVGDGLTLSGDEELATTLADNLAFTI